MTQESNGGEVPGTPSRCYPANEFRRALYPMHRCRMFTNTIFDFWGAWDVPWILGWRKDCPCRRLPS